MNPVPSRRRLQMHWSVEERVSLGDRSDDACLAAAEEFGANANTIRTLHFRLRDDAGRSHGNSKLTQEQGSALLPILVVFSNLHCGLTPQQARAVAEKVLGAQMHPRTLRRWIKKRKETITLRKSKVLAQKRMDPEIMDCVGEFCAQVTEMNKRFPMSGENLANCDETRAGVSDNGDIIIESARKRRASRKGFRGRMLGSLLSFASPAAGVIMSLWIFKSSKDAASGRGVADFCIPTAGGGANSSWPRFCALNDASYDNGELQKKAISLFCDLRRRKRRVDSCCVFGDQLGCRYDIESARGALMGNIFLWRLPANASRFLQPLDDAMFARFKGEMKNSLSHIDFTQPDSAQSAVETLSEAAYEVEARALTKRAAQKPFENTGLRPFDEIKIKKSAKQNLALDAKEDGLKHVGQMTKAVQALSGKKRKRKGVRRGKAKIRKNETCSSEGALKALGAEEQERKKAEKELQEKKQKEEEERQAKRRRSTCASGNCGRCSRSGGEAKAWSKRSGCGVIRCKNRKEAFAQHGSVCSMLSNDAASAPIGGRGDEIEADTAQQRE